MYNASELNEISVGCAAPFSVQKKKKKKNLVAERGFIAKKILNSTRKE
jgi:hypothetical protein